MASHHAPKPGNRAVGLLVSAFLVVFGVMVAWPHVLQAQEQQPANRPIATLILETGKVKIALRPDLAPAHVARITELANSGFYDGLTFHRVIDGFMAQTGDPRGDGNGGSNLPDLAAEFSDVPFVRGTVGMARGAGSYDSANSQFFIVTGDAPHLNGSHFNEAPRVSLQSLSKGLHPHTLFGEVVEGLELVDGLQKGDPYVNNGQVEEPDVIVSLRVTP